MNTMDKLTTAERELKERELEIRETLCWLFTKLSLVDYEAAIGDVKEMAAGWQARAGERVPREPAEVEQWREAHRTSVAAVETYNAALIKARELDEIHGFGFRRVDAEYQAMTEASNRAHRLVGPMLKALYDAAPRAQPAPGKP